MFVFAVCIALQSPSAASTEGAGLSPFVPDRCGMIHWPLGLTPQALRAFITVPFSPP
jgi:hypothetical protein